MYNKASDYFKSLYKEKIYKISLDAGLSCPNRDKSKKGGCIFCSNGGSGEFAVKLKESMLEQISDAIKLVENKKARKFIAYFQSFTNTYGDIDYLRRIFNEAISDERIVGLSIATRPDSISDECYELLDELNKKKKVFVELGLQTSNDNTAVYINRGYKSEIYKECVNKLHRLGINVITHVIIGLPNENEKDLLNTINYVNPFTDGIKFTLLYVLKNTELYNFYKRGEYTPLTKDEYIRLLTNAIEHLSKDIVVHRITGDGPKDITVSPLYSLNKKDMLNSINKYFIDNNIIQGSKYEKN